MTDDDYPTVADGWRIGGKTIAFGVIVLVIVLALAGMAIFGVGWFKKSTADFRGDVAAHEKIHADGDYRIAAYEHFYDLCAAIQGKEATIAQLTVELDTAPERRTQEIRSTLSAIKASRAQQVNQYNVDARKEDTEGQFKASDLPYEIDVKGTETECKA